MPLYLVEPGRRKGNRYYLVRGTPEVGGRCLEVSTKTTDPAAARRFAEQLELKLRDSRVPLPGEAVKWSRAADLYRDSRGIDKRHPDWQRVERLKTEIGDKLCTEIVPAHLIDAAAKLQPEKSAATKNREVIRMGAAVLHYAAENKWCGWLRVKGFKEKRPATRAVTFEAARAVIANVPTAPPARMGNRAPTHGDLERHRVRTVKKKLLLLWLFRQGNRISDALRIRTEQLDMRARTIAYRVGKTDRDVVKALHDEVWELLANDPPAAGWLFPWRTKSGVYKWLRPYIRELGVAFTPHMARHSLGKWLNEDRAGLKTIMEMLDHLDVRSSSRYQSADIEAIRAATGRLQKLVGP